MQKNKWRRRLVRSINSILSPHYSTICLWLPLEVTQPTKLFHHDNFLFLGGVRLLFISYQKRRGIAAHVRSRPGNVDVKLWRWCWRYRRCVLVAWHFISPREATILTVAFGSFGGGATPMYLLFVTLHSPLLFSRPAVAPRCHLGVTLPRDLSLSRGCGYFLCCWR